MEDNESVEVIIIRGNDADEATPMVELDVGGIDGRGESEGADLIVETTQLGDFLEEEVEIENLESTRDGVLAHTDCSARIDKQNGGAMR